MLQINKAQSIILGLCFTILIISKMYNIEMIFIISITFLFIILVEIFLPILREKKKYNIYIHITIFYLPLWIHVIKSPNVSLINKYTSHFFIIVLLILCFVLNLEFLKKVLTGRVLVANASITPRNFNVELYQFCLALISEEIYFRMFLTTVMESLGIYTILIEACLFVIMHIANRHASYIFSLGVFLKQFILAILLGIIYFTSNSLLLAIIGHLLFNLPYLLILIKRRNLKEFSFE